MTPSDDKPTDTANHQPHAPSMTAANPAPGSPSSGGDASKASGRNTVIGVVGFVLALAGGFWLGQWFIKPKAPPIELVQGERYKVELRGDEPQMGPSDALVTIIEFSDFECPYCAKASPELVSAVEEYADDVRLIFKHYPLPFHRNAMAAARTSWAGLQQGKFWEVHDWLYEQKGDIKELPKFLQKLGVDARRFGADMESDGSLAAVDSDRQAGGRVGVTGTPAFFVNGHAYTGARPKEHWRKIIEAERAVAEALVERGLPRTKVYEQLMADAKTVHERADAAAANAPQVRKPVPVDDRPSLGPTDALVTVVQFSDFQCPFCVRAAPVIKQLAQDNSDVRVVFRNLPLPMHARARDAAKAALAADRQGKFWAMHDVLFERQAELDTLDFIALAKQLELDVARFESDMKDPGLDAMVSDDLALAQKLGVDATPTAFVNGRMLSGAQPKAAFQTAIESARADAQKIVDGGVARDQVYATMMRSLEGGAEGQSAP